MLSRALGSLRTRLSEASRRRARTALLKDACACGALSVIGDTLAQRASKRAESPRRGSRRNRNSSSVTKLRNTGFSWDCVRSARMGAFGLLVYGPMQHFWYKALKAQFGGRSAGDFAAKVMLNQVILGPIVCSLVFAWTLTLQRRQAEIRKKIENDLLPTMQQGWKFWVPASSMNFWYEPFLFRTIDNIAFRYRIQRQRSQDAHIFNIHPGRLRELRIAKLSFGTYRIPLSLVSVHCQNAVEILLCA